MTPRPTDRPIGLLSAGLVLMATTAASSPAHSPAHSAARLATNAPGVTYTIHFVVPNTTTAVDTGGGHIVDVPWEWTGRVEWANGRGRLDVTDGGYPGNFGFFIAKGDYVLFDSTDFVVVQPRMDRFFAVAPIDLLVRLLLSSQTPDTTGQFAGLAVSLDSLSPTKADVVAGQATRHYQVKTQFTHVVHETGKAPEPYKTTMILDYWLADSHVLPPNPFLRFAQADFETVGAWNTAPPPFQARLVGQTASAIGRLPAGRVILKASYVELEVGQQTAVLNNGTTLRHEDRAINEPSIIELGDITPATVDLTRLVLPSGVVESDSYRADLKAQFPDDARLAIVPAEKWRAMPGGG